VACGSVGAIVGWCEGEDSVNPRDQALPLQDCPPTAHSRLARLDDRLGHGDPSCLFGRDVPPDLELTDARSGDGRRTSHELRLAPLLLDEDLCARTEVAVAFPLRKPSLTCD
jgi:hypothetical protein